MSETEYVIVINKTRLFTISTILSHVLSDADGTYGITDGRLSEISRLVCAAIEELEKKIPELE